MGVKAFGRPRATRRTHCTVPTLPHRDRGEPRSQSGSTSGNGTWHARGWALLPPRRLWLLKRLTLIALMADQTGKVLLGRRLLYGEGWGDDGAFAPCGPDALAAGPLLCLKGRVDSERPAEAGGLMTRASTGDEALGNATRPPLPPRQRISRSGESELGRKGRETCGHDISRQPSLSAIPPPCPHGQAPSTPSQRNNSAMSAAAPFSRNLFSTWQDHLAPAACLYPTHTPTYQAPLPPCPEQLPPLRQQEVLLLDAAGRQLGSSSAASGPASAGAAASAWGAGWGGERGGGGPGRRCRCRMRPNGLWLLILAATLQQLALGRPWLLLGHVALLLDEPLRECGACGSYIWKSSCIPRDNGPSVEKNDTEKEPLEERSVLEGVYRLARALESGVRMRWRAQQQLGFDAEAWV